jgi:ligand-binding SRPBCC domain-containing protein
MNVEIKRDGRAWRLECSIVVPYPIEDVFGFFADAMNLEAITPPFLRFAVLTPTPIVMRPGRLIDYRLWLHGLPLRWQSEITAWEAPYRFVDEQRRGPYRRWVHEHRFEPCAEGTRVIDRVRYEVPGGDWIHRRFVAPDLRHIFEYRAGRLGDFFPPGGHHPVPAFAPPPVHDGGAGAPRTSALRPA